MGIKARNFIFFIVDLDSPVGDSPMGDSPTGDSPREDSPMGGHGGFPLVGIPMEIGRAHV